ncbi:hypothetical protein [uncultured Dysosmobacter sp.]|uniref:hypothetical protein n=1 Tax=uncultured Dysosmobacter sp. TaxID=2591384 RepID=UPI002617144D|nr:hypothetical protein [uncultured Dysosmobacter sp.]
MPETSIVIMAQANYDGAVRQLNLVTKATKDTENQLLKAIAKADGSNGLPGIVGTIAGTGLANLAGNAALEASKTMVSSSLGSSWGNIVSPGISTAVTGAAMGSRPSGKPIRSPLPRCSRTPGSPASTFPTWWKWPTTRRSYTAI